MRVALLLLLALACCGCLSLFNGRKNVVKDEREYPSPSPSPSPSPRPSPSPFSGASSRAEEVK